MCYNFNYVSALRHMGLLYDYVHAGLYDDVHALLFLLLCLMIYFVYPCFVAVIYTALNCCVHRAHMYATLNAAYCCALLYCMYAHALYNYIPSKCCIV